MMKNIIPLLCLNVLLISCTSQSEKSTSGDSIGASDMAAVTRQSEVDTNVNDLGTNRNAGLPPQGAYEKGAQLIKSSDCLSCHQEKVKLVGPSYVDVAKKYQPTDDNINLLADKIIKGGSGVWGDVPMTSHPAISDQDAHEMVKYILSLN
ncbi:c-type cytochrome [Arcticibacter eurypsychrophilus]|uniref:c-type cytochrome n=1 Tax=Arcticibacter eurypsychrophilus TaxID=1434752 RepID=UPI001FE0D673|nr:c-type cytochrome [Arcticibacter eurypsychrophilus]